MITYESIIIVSWLAFLLVWGFSAISVKKDVRGSGLGSVWSKFWILRIVVAVLVLIVVVRIATGTAHYSSLTNPFFSHILFVPPLWLGWIASILSVLGIAFAIWARFHLGRNWSSHPAVKENHELVTTGPYAYVRHPIYTGMLLAVFASLLTGMIFGIVGFVFGSIVFLTRIGREEKIMLELFPNEYPAYQKRTKKLIPFVW